MIAVIGRPNVGKSTLLNRLLGQKIAITSPKPQTTRDQLLGILTRDDAQMLFLDTPGIHQPLHKLGEHMVAVAEETIADADVVLWLVDVNTPPTEEDERIAALLYGLHRARKAGEAARVGAEQGGPVCGGRGGDCGAATVVPGAAARGSRAAWRGNPGR